MLCCLDRANGLTPSSLLFPSHILGERPGVRVRKLSAKYFFLVRCVPEEASGIQRHNLQIGSKRLSPHPDPLPNGRGRSHNRR